MEDIASPVAGPDQVVISTRAAGVNFPDLLIIQGKYQVKPPLPFSPGAECAGVVKAAGEGVTRFKVGDRVMATTTYGSFAEEISVDAWRAVPVPDGVDFVNAATLPVAYGTADHALSDRGALRPGETLLVLGAAGGVGLAAVEIGKAHGAYVIACASTAEKLAVCRQHGADAVINYATEDLRERIDDVTGGQGIDVVCDQVGGPYTEPALRSTKWRGRVLIVGFTSGEIARIPMNLPLLKGCSIVGVFWTTFVKRQPERFHERAAQLGRWFREGRIKPHISATFPLDRAADALALMASRRAIGKIVLTI
jgi:NADPH2:quinone reductase